MKIAALTVCLALFLSGCGSPREWYIPEGERPTVAIPSVGTVEFLVIKNRDDYLRLVFVLKNTSDQPLRFVAQDDRAWGFVLVPDQPTLTASRVDGATEPLVYIAPGKSQSFDCLWRIDPAADGTEWTWTLDIVGLRAGERVVEPVVVKMPAYKARPATDNRPGG